MYMYMHEKEPENGEKSTLLYHHKVPDSFRGWTDHEITSEYQIQVKDDFNAT